MRSDRERKIPGGVVVQSQGKLRSDCDNEGDESSPESAPAAPAFVGRTAHHVQARGLLH